MCLLCRQSRQIELYGFGTDDPEQVDVDPMFDLFIAFVSFGVAVHLLNLLQTFQDLPPTHQLVFTLEIASLTQQTSFERIANVVPPGESTTALSASPLYSWHTEPALKGPSSLCDLSVRVSVQVRPVDSSTPKTRFLVF